MEVITLADTAMEAIPLADMVRRTLIGKDNLLPDAHLLQSNKGNPLPSGLIQSLKVEMPNPPSPQIFTERDYKWIRAQVVPAVAAAFRAPDAKTPIPFTKGEKNGLMGAIYSMSITVATRALEKYDAQASSKVDRYHVELCGVLGMISSDRARMDKLQFRIEALEKALHARNDRR